MSVELNAEQRRDPGFWTHHLIPGPVHDTLIFYGGYEEGMTAGGPLTQYTQHKPGSRVGNRSSWTAWTWLSRYFKREYTKDMDPARQEGFNNQAVRKGMEFLLQGGVFDPRGKLVIYGFSAGGFNAVGLCRRINLHRPWYNITNRTLGFLDHAPTPQQPFAPVRVDLLVTVDPCLEDVSGHENYQVIAPRPLVKWHANYYQHQPRATVEEHYWGVSELHADINHLQPILPNQGHNDMPILTWDKVRHDLLEGRLGLRQVH